MVNVLVQRFKLIFVWGILGTLLFIGLSFLLPRQYSAESSVLLITRTQAGVDPYTQAKSAERIGENVAQVMGTNDFYQKVIESKAEGFDATPWKILPERDRRKKWQKDVVGQVQYGASILRVSAFGDTPEDAVALGNAVTQTIVDRGWEYVGGDVVFKEVDAPLAKQLPARPNFLFNAGVGFWIGIVLSALWIVTYRRHAIFRT